MRQFKKSFYAKLISVILVIFFVNGNSGFYANQVDYQDHFQKALKSYHSDLYSDTINLLEKLLNSVDKENKSLIGKIHLLMGASYEKLNLVSPAERYYRLVKESKLSVGDLKVIDLNALPLCRKILLGLEMGETEKPEVPQKARVVEEKVKKNGIYEHPAIKPKKKKFPWLIVIGGVILAGVISLLLLRKKDKESRVEEQAPTGPVTIKITSNFGGTDVYIDGNAVGTAPLTTSVNPGEHEVSLIKKNIGQAKRNINFQNGKAYTIKVSLSGFTYQFVKKWSKFNPNDSTEPFNIIMGIDVSTDGYVYVADYEGNRIWKFDTNGKFIKNWFFDEPHDVATDSRGYVYATNDHNVIKKYTSKGKSVDTWGGDGNGYGKFGLAMGIEIDKTGAVYVCDWENRVQKFNSNGTFIMQWGSSGNGNGQFNIPYEITIDTKNNVYICDQDNHRIQKFSSNGNYSTKWGKEGTGKGEFKSPSGIVSDGRGYIFVVDGGNWRIQKFTTSGVYLASWGSFGSGNNQFRKPRDIAVDKNGYVYVTDSGKSCVSKFQISSQTEDDGEWVINTSNSNGSRFSGGLKILNSKTKKEIFENIKKKKERRTQARTVK